MSVGNYMGREAQSRIEDYVQTMSSESKRLQDMCSIGVVKAIHRNPSLHYFLSHNLSECVTLGPPSRPNRPPVPDDHGQNAPPRAGHQRARSRLRLPPGIATLPDGWHHLRQIDLMVDIDKRFRRSKQYLKHSGFLHMHTHANFGRGQCGDYKLAAGEYTTRRMQGNIGDLNIATSFTSPPHLSRR